MTSQKSLTYPFPIESLKKWTLQEVVDELRDPERIVDLPDTATVQEALDVMNKENISAVLVYQEKEGKEYQCFVTLKDIIHYCVFQVC